jgi:hypothetical protein
MATNAGTEVVRATTAAWKAISEMPIKKDC